MTKDYQKTDYKCSECGLEIIIYKQKAHVLPAAECENCQKKTMAPRIT